MLRHLLHVTEFYKKKLTTKTQRHRLHCYVGSLRQFHPQVILQFRGCFGNSKSFLTPLNECYHNAESAKKLEAGVNGISIELRHPASPEL